MGILDRFHLATKGIGRILGRSPEKSEGHEVSGDGHAPGHRKLGPPPKTGRPNTVDTEPRSNQPWIRTTHSDSQIRRGRD